MLVLTKFVRAALAGRGRSLACAAAAAGLWPAAVRATPLDPNAFQSLGTLAFPAGTYNANTSGTPTLTVGGTTYTGAVVAQGAGLPEVAVFTFNTVEIGNGVTINATGTRPLAVLSRGDITFGGNGSIVLAAGGAGGAAANSGPGVPTGGGGSARNGFGSGGAGFGGTGGMGGGTPVPGVGGEPGGPAYGNLLAALQGGSGGRTGDGLGGSGGAALELGAVGAVRLTADTRLDVSGGSAAAPLSLSSRGGGGGGSGGGLLLHAATVTANPHGTLRAAGGAGGSGNFGFVGVNGGGGGGGRVLIRFATFTAGSTALPSVDAAGGGLSGLFGLPYSGDFGAAGSARLVVDDTFVPAGQLLNLDAPAAGLNEFTTTNLTVRGGVASRAGSYVNPGIVTVDVGGTFAAGGQVGGGSWQLNGGQVSAPAGFALDAGTTVVGRGTLAGPVRSAAAGNGSISAAGGTLTVGDANSTAGVDFDGLIVVGDTGAPPAAVVLLDKDRAVIGETFIGAGSLSAPNGTTFRAGHFFSAPSGGTVGGAFTNNGTVSGGASAGAFLTFTDDVDGAGSYLGNVKFSDGFSPGNSPANVSLQNLAFDGTTDLVMELGGRTPGTQYDRLTITGTGTLGGTLDVRLINGFTPALGDSFLLLDGGTLNGSFANVNLPPLPAGERWVTSFDGNDYAIAVTAVPEPAAGLLAAAGMAFLAGRRRSRRR